MALLKMISDITNELENKNYSLGVFIDLSKAFDTVDHTILIKKNVSLWNSRDCFGLVYKLFI